MTLTADDIVKIMDAASRTGILTLTIPGVVDFTRIGYLPPATPAQQMQAAIAEVRQEAAQGQDWLQQDPPSLVGQE